LGGLENQLSKEPESESIVVAHQILSMALLDPKQRSDDRPKPAIEQPKRRQNGISVAVAKCELPLSRNNHSNTSNKEEVPNEDVRSVRKASALMRMNWRRQIEEEAIYEDIIWVQLS
jgi:hypothetical protein